MDLVEVRRRFGAQAGGQPDIYGVEVGMPVFSGEYIINFFSAVARTDKGPVLVSPQIRLETKR